MKELILYEDKVAGHYQIHMKVNGIRFESGSIHRLDEIKAKFPDATLEIHHNENLD